MLSWRARHLCEWLRRTVGAVSVASRVAHRLSSEASLVVASLLPSALELAERAAIVRDLEVQCRAVLPGAILKTYGTMGWDRPPIAPDAHQIAR